MALPMNPNGQSPMFNPYAGQGAVNIQSPWGGASQIDPSQQPGAYGFALQQSAAQRGFGTPNYLGGPGGLPAFGMQGVQEAMNALSNTTGKQYGYDPKHLPGQMSSVYGPGDMQSATPEAHIAALQGLMQSIDAAHPTWRSGKSSSPKTEQ